MASDRRVEPSTPRRGEIVLRSAALMGIVAFLCGFVGPAVLSRSNLGPLLGVFITGPAGLIAGALWGVLRSAAEPAADEGIGLFAWLIGIWLVTLLYTIFMIGLVARLALVPLALQLVAAGCALWLPYRISRSRSAAWSLTARSITLVLLVLGIAFTLFPPVQATRSSISAGHAFLLGHELDAGQHVPPLRVRDRALMTRFALLAAAAVGAVAVFTRRATRPIDEAGRDR